VSLSVEPFDELRKLRQEAHFDEELSAIDTIPASGDCSSTSVPLPLVQRRLTQSSACDVRNSIHVDDDDDEEDNEEYDTESVSSDKCELHSFCMQCCSHMSFRT